MEELMERGEQETQQQPVFDFEVKEQDRWLPIANGKSLPTLDFLCRSQIWAFYVVFVPLRPPSR
jgi:hypothetical protein